MSLWAILLSVAETGDLRYVKSFNLANLVQLLDDREDEDCREQADACQNAPDSNKAEVLTPHDAWEHYELIADSSSTEPQTHHQTCILRRSHLRYERDTDRREQKLSKGEDEVCRDEEISTYASALSSRVALCERQLKTHRAYSHPYEAESSYKHTQTNLLRRCRLLANLVEPRENSHTHWCQRHHVARVELLEDRSLNVYCTLKSIVSIEEV